MLSCSATVWFASSKKIPAKLSGMAGATGQAMIGAARLKAFRTAARPLKDGLFPDVPDASSAA
jgi:hypothetical protein